MKKQEVMVCSFATKPEVGWFPKSCQTAGPSVVFGRWITPRHRRLLHGWWMSFSGVTSRSLRLSAMLPSCRRIFWSPRRSVSEMWPLRAWPPRSLCSTHTTASLPTNPIRLSCTTCPIYTMLRKYYTHMQQNDIWGDYKHNIPKIGY